jgi:hypothetical protein
MDKYHKNKFNDMDSKEVKKTMEMKNVPEHIRVGGIDVAVWSNNDGGKTFQTVTLQRSYKDKEGKWAKASSFRVNDIPKAILALQKAYENLTVKE